MDPYLDPTHAGCCVFFALVLRMRALKGRSSTGTGVGRRFWNLRGD